ncbi:MAG TPA: aldo/keto reductase [Gemmatimonadaceae bacterium]|nr:aldo/keto reductase [Gemmatimonadaceae bacterium]
MNARTPRNETAAPAVDSGVLRATDAGTRAYARRHAPRFAADFHRETPFGLSVSSLGIGTYLGEPTAAHDDAYEAAVVHAIDSGINLIDTAINYRCQRSELAVGAAIQRAIATGAAARDELVLCSKGGYIPLDGTPPESRDAYREYVRREFVEPEILRPDEIVAGGHSLAPRFLRYCIAKSRQNLGIRTIDVYYLHNPEQQAAYVDPAELRDRIRAAFAVLEESASRGEIGVYGCATWDGLRAPAGAPGHLSLEELVALAHDVAGGDHRFRVVQMPISMGMPEGVRSATQTVRGRALAPIDAARELGLSVVASASLMQGKLVAGLPAAVAELFPHATTDAQRAVTFVRSVPGVASALVGMKQPAHADELLAACREGHLDK